MSLHQICRYTDIQADIEFIDLKPQLFITVLKTSITELGGIPQVKADIMQLVISKISTSIKAG